MSKLNDTIVLGISLLLGSVECGIAEGKNIISPSTISWGLVTFISPLMKFKNGA